MDESKNYEDFIILHRNQLEFLKVPEIFWKAVHRKLSEQIFDAGRCVQLLKSDSKSPKYPVWALQAIEDIDVTDPNNVFLVDHCWTFTLEEPKKQMSTNALLRDRMCDILGVDKHLPMEEMVDTIFNSMWKICNFYTVAKGTAIENRLSVWYVMDEIGSAIVHNDKPNSRLVPLIHLEDQCTYSLLFPILDIKKGDFLSRDFAEGVSDPEKRSVILSPWVPKLFTSYGAVPPIPDEEYFLNGHIRETLPNLSNLRNAPEVQKVFNVFTEYELINTYLTSKSFNIVHKKEEADILWFTKHFTDYECLSTTPDKFINQFPFEYVITIKDLLCVTCRRSDNSKNWLPQTYNSLTELCYFLCCFQEREAQGLDNHWIIKPYNLARGLDIQITNNLDLITRLATIGPKIVQKYITDPVLFYRSECAGKVKFDIRYVLLLKSVKPLQAYVYKKMFLRFSNKPFELNDFQDYEKHFTVMNYRADVNLMHLKCEDFVKQFNDQYPDHPWENTEKLIMKMLRDIMESATSIKPPCGIGESPQSRAIYAADIMLQWTREKQMEPQILEINFMPDCQCACEYYPEFYNDIFGVLFLNQTSDNCLAL